MKKRIEEVLKNFASMLARETQDIARIIRNEKRRQSATRIIINETAYSNAEFVADYFSSKYPLKLKGINTLKILEDCTLVMLYYELCELGAREGWYRVMPLPPFYEVLG